MPKVRIIRVRSVEDIDISKVSVYDLSNRYVDVRGNMYGLKYNRKEKKIEIIKLIRTPVKSAGYFNKKVLEYRRGQMREGAQNAENETAEETSPPKQQSEYREQPEKDNADEVHPEISLKANLFDADAFIKRAVESMKGHRERLNGIMMNIKNSNVIRETDREASTYLIDVFRTLDIDGVQRIDKILAEHKELVSYPRSLVYYLAKLDTRSKNIVDSLSGESTKMRFIFLVEMFFAIRNLYKNLHKVLQELADFLASRNLEEARGLSHGELKMFEDGRISVKSTIAEAEEIIQGCMRLENHIFKEKKL